MLQGLRGSAERKGAVKYEGGVGGGFFTMIRWCRGRRGRPAEALVLIHAVEEMAKVDGGLDKDEAQINRQREGGGGGQRFSGTLWSRFWQRGNRMQQPR